MAIGTLTRLQRVMDKAESYEEWTEAAKEHDHASGKERWRNMDQTRRYDYVSIRMRLDALRAMRARHDNHALLFNLNEGIHGNMGGMGKQELYGFSKFGTKRLISDYIDETVSALEHLARPDVTDVSFEEKLDFFRRADHCYGSTALLMSGSGTLLYFHLGVVKALLEEGLLPSILSGSSGGAIVAAIVGTHTDEEMLEMHDLEQISERFGIVSAEEVKRGAFNELMPIMPIEDVKATLSEILPDYTFQEAYEKTGRLINVSVAPAEQHQTSRLLNAFTSPNVFIREAVLASAAVPGIYPPVTLMAKNVHGERQAYLPSRKWVDGSVSDDLPMKRLGRLYGVNHCIVSQANPFVVPFITETNEARDPVGIIRQTVNRTALEWFNASSKIFSRPLSLNPMLNKMIGLFQSVINQEYVGDINILAPTKAMNPLKLLAPRSEEDIRRMMDMGERAAWPKIEMIRIQTAVSRTLRQILQEYEHEYVEHVTKVTERKRA